MIVFNILCISFIKINFTLKAKILTNKGKSITLFYIQFLKNKNQNFINQINF